MNLTHSRAAPSGTTLRSPPASRDFFSQPIIAGGIPSNGLSSTSLVGTQIQCPLVGSLLPASTIHFHPARGLVLSSGVRSTSSTLLVIGLIEYANPGSWDFRYCC